MGRTHQRRVKGSLAFRTGCEHLGPGVHCSGTEGLGGVASQGREPTERGTGSIMGRAPAPDHGIYDRCVDGRRVVRTEDHGHQTLGDFGLSGWGKLDGLATYIGVWPDGQ